MLFLVGLTYAYFLTTIKENKEEKSVGIQSANLSLVYDDGDGSILSSSTELMPSLELTSETAIGTKMFKVINEGDYVDYSVIIEDINIFIAGTTTKTSFNSNDFVYTLTCKTENGSECNNQIKDEPKKLPLVNGAVLISNIIDTKDTHIYTLTLWYKDNGFNQNDDMNKTLEARVNIISDTITNPYGDKTSSLAYNIINNSFMGKNGTALTRDPLTKVGVGSSSVDEKTLSITQDDYDNSFYYRGNVEDNYLNFAGMCWRIVRIDGNGNVKIILEDQYAECDDNVDNDGEGTADHKYTGNWVIGNGEFGTEPWSEYNADSLCEGAEKMNYLEPKKENQVTPMVKGFYDFQNTLNGKISLIYSNKSNSDFLVSGNWCLDDQAYSLNKNPLTSEEKKNHYLFADDYMLFGANLRLQGEIIAPSLKCGGTLIQEFKKVVLDGRIITEEANMYVSTLTADEVVYAGSGQNSYLLNKFHSNSNYYWWTISPSHNDGADDYIFVLFKDGFFRKYRTYWYTYSYEDWDNWDTHTGVFRPAVNLKAGINIQEGTDGTISNPYVVIES